MLFPLPIIRLCSGAQLSSMLSQFIPIVFTLCSKEVQLPNLHWNLCVILKLKSPGNPILYCTANCSTNHKYEQWVDGCVHGTEGIMKRTSNGIHGLQS